MKDIKIPITECENGGFKVEVDPSIYTNEALTATCYKYTDNFYVHQQTDSLSGMIVVVFESKNKEKIVQNVVVKQFCNDLIDQQVRFDINNRFGHIRDLIVEEAFKPVNK